MEVWFGDHRIASLPLADDDVLLTSSGQDLQRVLGWFTTKCEAAGTRVITAKSEGMFLTRERWFVLSGWLESSWLGQESLGISA